MDLKLSFGFTLLKMIPVKTIIISVKIIILPVKSNSNSNRCKSATPQIKKKMGQA
jgi:hypothetical protein